MMKWMLALNLILVLRVDYILGLHPVVLIPGNGGNQIEGRVTKEWDGGDCPRPKGWQRLWLNIWQLLPSNVDCWNKKMMLQYNQVTHTSHNLEGVETRVPGFGNTTAVEYLDPSAVAWMLGNAGAYFSKIVKELVKVGYERGKSIRAAPYDFRYGPHSQEQYFDDLKGMIESMYVQSASKERIVLVAHSAGGLFTLYFLNQQSQNWKNKYIESIISLGTPWAGSSIVFEAFTSGFNFNVPVLLPRAARNQQRTSETNMLLLPKTPGFDEHKIFVTTPKKKYSLHNVNELFHDVGYKDGSDKLMRFKGNDYKSMSPGVNMHCWYGTGIKTPDSYIYDDEKNFPDVDPVEVVMVDGDETVQITSLQFCKQWKNVTDVFDIKEYPGQTHNGLLFHKPMLEDLKKIVLL